MIYIRNETADILDMFDDVLCAHGIKVPSPEDNERGEENEAALYGTVYAALFDEIEGKLTEIALLAQGGEEINIDEWRPPDV